MINAATARNDPAYIALKEFLIERTGLAYYKDRDDDLAERIGRRLKSLRIDGYRSYFTLLRAEPSGKAELDRLIEELTIGETYFFRNSDQFDALRNVILPRILDRNLERRTLRIWSAGCANGAEAYSLSVMLHDEFASPIRDCELSILGTDVNRRFLTEARRGRFENWALRGMAPEARDRIFRPADGGWLIKERYREGVAFQYHNLVKDVAPSLLNNLFAFDLVLCRNVMIYFDRPTVAGVVSRLRDCIVERGWLVAGHADIDIDAFRVFETVTAGGVTVYRKPRELESATDASQPACRYEKLPAKTLIGLEDAPVILGGGQTPRRPQAPTSYPGAPDHVMANPAAANPGTTAPGGTAPARPAIERVRELADAGAWEEADRCCAALLERIPLDPLAHFYDALIQEHMGRLAEAERSLRRSIYLDRGFVLGHYHLGLLLQRDRERSGAARRCFENVRSLLGGVDRDFLFPHGDGITAACLRELTEMQLEVL